MDTQKNIIFFDGTCGFCNFWVKWLIKRDKKHVFCFASFQSETARQYGVEKANPDTLLLIYRQTVLTKSRAVAAILSELSLFFRIVSTLIMLFPVCWADRIYSAVAAVRHRISGNNTCTLHHKERYQSYILK